MKFDVRVRCVVIKSLTCDGPSEDAVRNDPWEYCIDETEIDKSDWDLISIKEDE